MLVFITTKGFDHVTLSKVPLVDNNKIYPINPYIPHILARFVELLQLRVCDLWILFLSFISHSWFPRGLLKNNHDYWHLSLKPSSTHKPQIPVFQFSRLSSSLRGLEVPGKSHLMGFYAHLVFVQSTTLRITGVGGTTQAQRHNAKQFKSLFPPKVANSESGNVGLLGRNKLPSAT